AVAADGDAPLLEHPRKQIFGFVLRELGIEEALPAIHRASRSDDRHIRLAGAEALAGFRGPEAEASLAQLVRDPSHRGRAAAASAFLNRGVEPPGVRREELLAHVWIAPDDRNWRPILELREAARPALELAAGGDDPVVRREAARALRTLDFAAARRGGGESKGMFRLWRRKRANPDQPAVLILTPVKDAAAFIPGYYQRIN